MAPAQQPLFSWVDRTVLQRRSTRCFLALFKYYHAQTGVEERMHKGERAEQWEFLNVMYNLQLTYTKTPPLLSLSLFLRACVCVSLLENHTFVCWDCCGWYHGNDRVAIPYDTEIDT